MLLLDAILLRLTAIGTFTFVISTTHFTSDTTIIRTNKERALQKLSSDGDNRAVIIKLPLLRIKPERPILNSIKLELHLFFTTADQFSAECASRPAPPPDEPNRPAGR